jgi:tRNA threonylcarbamoyladenosine biosynthesis protein TsaB
VSAAAERLASDRPLVVFATSGARAEVGLWRPGPTPAGRLDATLLGAGQARGRELLPAVERLLAAAGLAARDLGGLVVDVGPGTFTGVRLGVTAAKSLAFALGRPVVPVVSLEALARGAPPARAVVAVRDAGRGTLYAQGFTAADAGGTRRTTHPASRLEAGALRAWPPDALLVGEEAEAVAQAHGLPQAPQALRADAVSLLALAREGRAPVLHDPTLLVPLYLQASAPERLRGGEAPPAPVALATPVVHPTPPAPPDRPKRVEG